MVHALRTATENIAEIMAAEEAAAHVQPGQFVKTDYVQYMLVAEPTMIALQGKNVRKFAYHLLLQLFVVKYVFLE